MYASPFCLFAFAREIKKLCIALYVAGGFRIKLSVSFVFKLERLSSKFVFTFSKLLNINYFHTCEVLFHKGRKLRFRECAFRDNNTRSVSGSNIKFKENSTTWLLLSSRQLCIVELTKFLAG